MVKRNLFLFISYTIIQTVNRGNGTAREISPCSSQPGKRYSRGNQSLHFYLKKVMQNVTFFCFLRIPS